MHCTITCTSTLYLTTGFSALLQVWLGLSLKTQLLGSAGVSSIFPGPSEYIKKTEGDKLIVDKKYRKDNGSCSLCCKQGTWLWTGTGPETCRLCANHCAAGACPTSLQQRPTNTSLDKHRNWTRKHHRLTNTWTNSDLKHRTNSSAN